MINTSKQYARFVILASSSDDHDKSFEMFTPDYNFPKLMEVVDLAVTDALDLVNGTLWTDDPHGTESQLSYISGMLTVIMVNNPVFKVDDGLGFVSIYNEQTAHLIADILNWIQPFMVDMRESVYTPEESRTYYEQWLPLVRQWYKSIADLIGMPVE